MKIFSAEKTLNFGNCSLKCPMGEAGLFGLTDILNSDVTDGSLAGDADIYYEARIFFVDGGADPKLLDHFVVQNRHC